MTMIPDRFVIPVLVAAAAHAALFVILPSAAPGDAPLTPDAGVPSKTLPPAIEIFEQPVTSELQDGKPGGGGQPVPQLAEPLLRPNSSDFEVPKPKIVPTVTAPLDAKRVPIESPGRPDGVRGIGGTDEVVAGSLLDQEPRARVRVPPEYPFEMKRQGVEGEVQVAFVVAADGSVRDAYAVSSNRRELEMAAVRAVLRWKFEPGRYRGRPVSFRMSVPIVFRLDPDA